MCNLAIAAGAGFLRAGQNGIFKKLAAGFKSGMHYIYTCLSRAMPNIMLCHAKHYAVPCQTLCCAVPNIMLCRAKYYAVPDK